MRAVKHWFVWLAVAIVIAQYAAALFTDQTFFYRDLLTGLMADAWLKSSSLSHGHWPLWNPGIFGGFSNASNPGAQPFYPLQIIYVLPWPQLALAVFIAVHHLLAAVGTAAWARRLGASEPASALAGAAFGLSAFSISLDNLTLYLCAYAWLPWVLWAAEFLVEGRWREGVLGVGCFLAMVFLAGDPQATLFGGALVAGRVLGRSWSTFAALGLAALITVGLSCVALLPGLMFLRGSIRLDDVTPETAQIWSLSPFRLIEAFVAQPFGQTYPVRTFWGEFTFNSPFDSPYLLSLYCSAVLAVFAPLGFFSLPTKRLKVLFGLAAGLLILGALGDRIGLYGALFRWLPLWKVFRYPERLVPPVVLLASVCGGFGYDEVLRGKGLRWVLGAGAVLAASAGALWLIEPIDWLRSAGAVSVSPDGFHWSLRRCFEAAALVTVAGVIARSPRLALRAQLLAIVIIGDIALHGASFVWTTSVSELRTHAPMFIEPGRRLFSHPSKFAFDASVGLGFEDQVTQHLVATVQPNTAGLWGAEYLAAYGTNFPARFSKMWKTVPTVPLLRLWGVAGGVAEKAEFDSAFAPSPHVQAIDTVGSNVRFILDSSETREWLSFDWLALTSGGELKEWMRRLETPSPPTLVEVETAATLTPLVSDPEARLECERLGPNVRECTVSTAQSALLVVSESFDEGWRATVDGVDAAIHRVNLNMQAVQVPPGAHEVRLVYRPTGVVIGGVISLLTLLAVGAGGFLSGRSQRLRRNRGLAPTVAPATPAP